MKLKFVTLWATSLLVLFLAACGGIRGDSANNATEGTSGDGDAKGGTEESLEAFGGGFEWRREGGIAGFCDVVTVLAGTATIASCAADPPEVRSEITLTAEQSRQVLTWLEELQTFDYEESDPATADGLTITIIFAGKGDNEPAEEDIMAIQALANELLRANSN